ncbi:MAG: hypothetical protein CK548_07155 [Opitutia bacterium]|nr:MAG: hypothetical protein CK548_07155 [Opitutae bacterium]
MHEGRLICAATAAMMIMEAWMKRTSPDGTLDLTVPLSQSLYRRELVVLTGESRGGCRKTLRPIIRMGAGGFFGCGQFATSPETTFSGRFAQILPDSASPRALRVSTIDVRSRDFIAVDTPR